MGDELVRAEHVARAIEEKFIVPTPMNKITAAAGRRNDSVAPNREK